VKEAFLKCRATIERTQGPTTCLLAYLIVNADVTEVPPAVVTVMFALPVAAMRFGGMTAQTVVAFPYVVVNEVLFHLADISVVKFVPLIVSRNAGPPAVADSGLNFVIVGNGGLIMNVAAVEVPSLVVTVTLALPAVAMSVAGIVAVSLLALK
jgi:hypothetical protein